MDSDMARTLGLSSVILLVFIVGNVIYFVACDRRRRRDRAERVAHFMATLNAAAGRVDGRG